MRPRGTHGARGCVYGGVSWRGDDTINVQTSVSFQWTSTPHFGHGMTKVERPGLAWQARVLQEGTTSPRASSAARYARNKQRQAVTPVVSHSGQEQLSGGHRPPNSSWSLAGEMLGFLLRKHHSCGSPPNPCWSQLPLHEAGGSYSLPGSFRLSTTGRYTSLSRFSSSGVRSTVSW